MDITALIDRNHVEPALLVNDKASLLRELSQRAARALGVEPKSILNAIRSRESLGSTGVGSGIAMPHARIPGLQQFFGYFARLQHSIGFDAIDGQPVDIVFFLLTPDRDDVDPLTALACVSRILRNRSIAAKIRAAGDTDAVCELIGVNCTNN